MERNSPRKSKASDDPGTRQRALDAAEHLFVTLGYEGTSLRAVAGRAGVNLGSIVYHFETKEGLFRALCQERLGGVLRRQAEALGACADRRRRGEPLTLADAIRALVEPALVGEAPAQNLQGLYALVFTDPSEVVLRIGQELFGEGTDLLHELVRGFLPELAPAEFFWRYVCAIGGFVVAQAFAERMALILDARAPRSEPAMVADILVSTIVRALGEIQQGPSAEIAGVRRAP